MFMVYMNSMGEVILANEFRDIEIPLKSAGELFQAVYNLGINFESAFDMLVHENLWYE